MKLLSELRRVFRINGIPLVVSQSILLSAIAMYVAELGFVPRLIPYVDAFPENTFPVISSVGLPLYAVFTMLPPTVNCFVSCPRMIRFGIGIPLDVDRDNLPPEFMTSTRLAS